MKTLTRGVWASCILTLGAASFGLPPAGPATTQPASAPLTFEITFDAAVSDHPYTGRVWVFTGRSARREPRHGPDWFHPSPLFAREVRNWKPGEPLVFDDQVLAFPKPPSEVRVEGYYAQAVIALNPDARQHGDGVGNAYSKPVRIRSDHYPVKLRINKLVEAERPPRGERVKPFEVSSRLLAEFHHRPIKITGAVILPEEYATLPESRRFPTLYVLPGFGQTRETAWFYARPTPEGATPLVQVLLDADCATGLHEFADSAVNGPCGQALIEEVIPFLEKKYRLISEPTARFLTGHSSGGWASLWLQITYPDYFGGTWSTSPDPVDFREFTNVDVYANDGNAFRDRDGELIPLARRDGTVSITFKQFSDMDRVVGLGEQLGSFEAVFSPRGPDGKALPLWDRKTGRIDPAVAKAWEKYDIRLILERNWRTLGPKLKGKLHIYVGGDDTFYLNEAVALLKKSQDSLGSDADIRILPDHDHFSIMMSPELRGIPRAVSEQFHKYHP